MKKITSIMVCFLIIAMAFSIFVSCNGSSDSDETTATVGETVTETQEAVPETENDVLIPEDKPKNMDTSNANVIIDATNEGMHLRFRNDGTGILIGSVNTTYDGETKTFKLDDGREIKLISDTEAEVDGVAYTYRIAKFPEGERYFFESGTDEKQLTIFEKSYRLVVHLAFNYVVNDTMLAMDFDYKFYGEDAELYTAEYSIDDYRGTMQIGDTKFEYSDGTNDYSLLSSTKSPDSYWLYAGHKGEMNHYCDGPLTVIEDGKRFEYKDSEYDISIAIINDIEAEVNGESFDYESRESNSTNIIELFSKNSKMSYDLYFFESDLLPPSIVVNYEFDYTFDGSKLEIDFGGLLDNVVGTCDDAKNFMIIEEYEYTVLGDIPSEHIK